jgi:hypothetical protein
MKRLLVSLWTAFGAVAVAADLAPQQTEFFENKIRPVLVEHCYKCHSTEAGKDRGGLLLDTRDAMLKGGDNGPAIVPGDAGKSLLIAAIKREDPDTAMPPKGKGEPFTAEQVADFETWVKSGAPDPRTGAVAVSVLDGLMEKAKTHWAFQPVKPSTVNGNFIDALAPSKSPHADARTLVRRAYVDLIGMPPTPEQVDAFFAESAQDAARAFERLLDELLASPRYGERWGRHWLDVARYADNMGAIFSGDDTYPFAFTYRDWVIRAFNDDMPYDRFILEQLAADLLPDFKPEDNRSLAALGFLTVGRRTDRKVDDNVYDDRIDVISRGLLGLSVGCARCHDHKLEPIPTKDYYALYGILKSCTEPDVLPQITGIARTEDNRTYDIENAKQRGEYARILSEMVEGAFRREWPQVGSFLLAMHDTQNTSSKKDSRLRAGLLKDRKLSFAIYDQIVEAKPEWWEKNKRLFSAWQAFAALAKEEFAQAAPGLAEKFAANADGALDPAIAALFAGAAPASLEDVAKRYDGLFTAATERWLKASAVAMKQALELDPRDLGTTPKLLHETIVRRITEALWTGQVVAGDASANLFRSKEGPWYFSNVPNFYSMQAGLILEPEGKPLQKVQKDVERLTVEHPGAPIRAMAVQEDKPFDAKVFIRGNPKTLGADAPRQYFTALRAPDAAPFPKDQSGRLQLAQRIASRDNPLTARVIVNRVWAWHFGEGLVKTPSDFGLRGERPTNPALLDALAAWFMDNGWSFKKLHRLILTSRVWQESGHTQPLDFEAFRDSLLTVAGALDTKGGGQPDNLVKVSSNRRTVYAFVDRKTLPNLFRSFDFPDPSFSAPQRSRTALTPQALFLLNSPFVVDRARDLAKLIKPDSADAEPSTIRALYRRAFQREPSEREVQRARAFLSAYPAHDIVMPEVDDWSYGTGDFDEAAQRVAHFAALKFAGDKVKGSDGVELNREGGQPGKDKAIVRRWTAPRDGKVNIYAELAHLAKEGDGVSSRLVCSRLGSLGEWTAAHNAVLTTLNDIKVKKGDTLDFLTVCRGDAKGDTFRWSPTITMPTAEMPGMTGMAMRWDAKSDFMDPAKLPTPLTAWEELAQVLLLSNEFAVTE